MIQRGAEISFTENLVFAKLSVRMIWNKKNLETPCWVNYLQCYDND